MKPGAMLTLLVLAVNPGNAQAPIERPQSAAAFQSVSDDAKRSTLNDLGAHRYSPAPTEVVEMIAAGLAAPNADIRLAAVYAAAGRAGAVRFDPSADQLAKAREERPFLGRLRPAILRALADPSDRIRRGAIVALVNLEYTPGSGLNDVRLEPDVADQLRLQLSSESSPAVRAELVKTFALTSLESPWREDVLIRALSDRDSEVLHFAVMGLGRTTPSAALEQLVALVSHPDRAVRLQVAQALQAYGMAAQPYLNALTAAAATEPDEAVKKTLDAAVARIQKPR